MQQLHLVGFTADHRGLILGAQKDTESGNYLVIVDNGLVDQIEELLRLREEKSAQRGADANGIRPLLARSRPESRLTPREVQASLRTGQSLREVAAAAGVPEEWVARFAAPVLAEQAQVIERTNQLTYTKPRLGPSTQPLAEAVSWNLADRGVTLAGEEFANAWSAFQQGDGMWVVRVAYLSRKRSQHADWVADLSEGTLTAVNRLAAELAYVEPGRRRPPGLRPLTPVAAASAAARPPPTTAGPRPAVPTTTRSVAAAAMAAAAARSAAAADAARSMPPPSASRSTSTGSGGRPGLSPPLSGRAPAPARPGPASPPAPNRSTSTSILPATPTTSGAAGPASIQRPSATASTTGGKDKGPGSPAAAKRPRPLVPAKPKETAAGRSPAASASGGTPERGVPARTVPTPAPARAARPTPSSRPTRPTGSASRLESEPRPLRAPARSSDPAPKSEGPRPARSGRDGGRPADIDQSLSPATPTGGSSNGGSRPLFSRPERDTPPHADAPVPASATGPRAATPAEAANRPAAPAASTAPPEAPEPATERPPRPVRPAMVRSRPAAARSMSTADRFGPVVNRAGSPAPRAATPRPVAGRDPRPATPASRPDRPVGGRAAEPATPASRPDRPVGGRAAEPVARATPAPVRSQRRARPLTEPDRPRRERPLVAPGRRADDAGAGDARAGDGARDQVAATEPRRATPTAERGDRARKAANEPDTAPVAVVTADVAAPSPAPDHGPSDEGIVLIKAGQAGMPEDDLARDPYEEQWRNAGPRAEGDEPPEDRGRRSRLRFRRRSGSR